MRVARLAPLSTDRKISKKSVPFVIVHLACVAVIFTDVSVLACLLCLTTYALRMFAVTAGYHRYFSHRSYKTSRWFQFTLAAVACSAGQKGPLWWAAHHRRHHRHADTEGDVHSPRLHGMWWAHVGWILSTKYEPTEISTVRDFARYPELRWLNDWHSVPAAALAILCFLVGGRSGLVWGFFVSTVMLYHATFAINSVSHMWGSIRYETNDDSRNNLLLALVTGGEGWHNNHHHSAASANQGFFWWEVDFSYYVLRILSAFGIVWDLRRPSSSSLLAMKRAPAQAAKAHQ